MPGPPPPPSPGGMLPPPPMPSMPKSSGPDDRSALLKSIQKGAKLKKTVTVDKSAPMIGGRVSNSSTSSNNNNSISNVAKSSNQQMNGGGNLGGLFAGGMPKLRSTGILSGASTNGSNFNNDENTTRRTPTTDSPSKNNNLQSELRKQMANDNRNRGPPPPAPVRHISEENGVKRFPTSSPDVKNSINGIRPNHSSLHSIPQNSATLHRKAKSQVNLNAADATSPVNGVVRPAINHGKPNLAPKPPVLNGKPLAPPKRLILPKGVNRAQSMKSPRSPSPQSPDPANGQIKFGTVRNMSSMLAQSLSGSTNVLGSPRQRPTINGRPTAPPPSVPPQQAPPPPPPQNSAPPPPSKTQGFVKPPNHAPPPPPPSHTPPPPPHKTLPTRAPPAVPNMNAPPPPPRHSSMTSIRKVTLEFEDKFKFQPVTTFPRPQPYKGVYKFYGNRQAGNKQQAPQPPNLQNRQWDPTSAC